MLRKLTLAICLIFVAGVLYAASKEQKRLENCAVVMQEILNIPDTIPQELLERTDCIVVLPSITKVAIGFGGSYGRGAMICRSGEQFHGPWGAPAMFALEGGSFGLQLGGQSTDLILLVMNQRGAKSILSSGVKLGADASVAAGPVGRDAAANTDAYMRAEVLSYSRSRGLFAGISLEGSTLRSDDDANKRVYGRQISASDIVLNNKVGVTTSGRHLVSVLQEKAPLNEKQQAAK